MSGFSRWFRWAFFPQGPLAGTSTPSAEQSSLVLSANVVAADGSTTVGYTATLRDAQGNPIVGRANVTAQAVSWHPLSEFLSGSFLSVSSPFIASDGVETVTITLQIGAQRNGVFYPWAGLAAADLGLAEDAANTTIAALSGTTDADGIIETTMTTTEPATVITISGTLFGQALIQTATVESDGEAVEPDPGEPFYAMPSDVEANVRATQNGVTWSTADGDVTVQTVPAGRTGYGLRFRYAGTGAYYNAEQRFTLGRDCAALWIEYYLYVPSNFAHQSVSPNNNKFLMVWRDTYGSGSGTWQPGYEYQLSGGNTVLRPMSSKESGTNATFVTSSGLGHPDHNAPFIGGSGPMAAGTWYRIRHELKAASEGGATDGVMRLWVDDTLVAEMTNGPFRNFGNSPADTVLRQGYLMGAANSGFVDQTDWYIHEVKFYDTDPEWAA